ncbi:hypothetical protein NHQ30_011352 [Ciborinia camelliae]|nr:hypothetical protein NHQ30_011352 [Ciborinia camelliae]
MNRSDRKHRILKHTLLKLLRFSQRQYSVQAKHCQKGMVLVVNENGAGRQDLGTGQGEQHRSDCARAIHISSEDLRSNVWKPLLWLYISPDKRSKKVSSSVTGVVATETEVEPPAKWIVPSKLGVRDESSVTTFMKLEIIDFVANLTEETNISIDIMADEDDITFLIGSTAIAGLPESIMQGFLNFRRSDDMTDTRCIARAGQTPPVSCGRKAFPRATSDTLLKSQIPIHSSTVRREEAEDISRPTVKAEEKPVREKSAIRGILRQPREEFTFILPTSIPRFLTSGRTSL